MTTRTPHECLISAAIIALMTLSAVMLLSLFTRTEPHPPLTVPIFALAPFLGASLAIGAAALQFTGQNLRMSAGLAIVFALTGLVSFGPQKYFDAAFPLIWPAVITAQVAIGGVLYASVKSLIRREDKRADTKGPPI